MKKLIFLFITIMISSFSKAQQLPHLTQYMINNYAINPAVAGMHDYYQVKTTIRNQWVGITDAPTTTILSIYGKKDKHVGLGGLVYNDQVGPTSRTGGTFSYTYHFDITRKLKMSLALSAGFTQFKIDKLGWNVKNSADPLTQGDIIVDAAPDATFGFNLYAKNWYLGAAIPQLLSANLELLDRDFARNFDKEMKGALNRHFFVLGAYKHAFNPYWKIEPSVLLKTVAPTPMQIDLGVKTIYDDKLWFGMDYRSNGDIGALLGYSFMERFMIGYSYDIVNTDLSEYAPGSHEFMLGIKFVPSEEKEIMK